MQNITELTSSALFPGQPGIPPVALRGSEFPADSRSPKDEKKQALSPEQAFVQALHYMDANTAAHSVRMTKITMRFARHLRLPADEQQALKIASYFHDIGKGAIDDRILQKSGPLTRQEFNVIRNHPFIGETLVAYLGLGIREGLILHHHERWDGRGYPQGLAGDEIPFLSQIMFLADSFDALISNRSYRPGCTVDKALAEIQACRGAQFNSELTLEFLAMFHASESSTALVGEPWPTI